MQQLAAYISMQFVPAQRLVVEPHGGHYWSTQGLLHRPVDLFTLRIDDQERLTMHLADDVKSPSAYMLAHLRQRGWRLPPNSSVIPNIVPQAAQSSTVRQTREVWRLAFFGRLEERKGLKLFCEAIESLDTRYLPKLEVIFIGSEGQVNMVPSFKYVQERATSWPMPVTIYGGLSRAAAMKILKKGGYLLVFASLLENLPFALAEACIEQIPFITFNSGGVAELFDSKAHADVIVETVTAAALAERISAILHEGVLRTSVLHPNVKIGAALWREFHTGLDHSTRLRQTNILTPATRAVDVVQLSFDHSSNKLKRDMCNKHSDAAFLLVPPEYGLPSPFQVSKISFIAAQLTRLSTSRSLGAVVFGATLPNDMVSYPSSPTWVVYHGSEPRCVENTPLLILAELFCTHFQAEAGEFTVYQSWVLIHHLRMAGLITSTFPEPVFDLKNFTLTDSGCFADNFPAFRRLNNKYAANLIGSSEETLMTQHVAPLPRPVVSFRAQFDRFQGQHGWQYIAIDDTGKPSASLNEASSEGS